MRPEYREVKKRLYDIAFEIKVGRKDPAKIMQQYIRLMRLALEMEEGHALSNRNDCRIYAPDYRNDK